MSDELAKCAECGRPIWRNHENRVCFDCLGLRPQCGHPLSGEACEAECFILG